MNSESTDGCCYYECDFVFFRWLIKRGKFSENHINIPDRGVCTRCHSGDLPSVFTWPGKCLKESSSTCNYPLPVVRTFISECSQSAMPSFPFLSSSHFGRFVFRLKKRRFENKFISESQNLKLQSEVYSSAQSKAL